MLSAMVLHTSMVRFEFKISTGDAYVVSLTFLKHLITNIFSLKLSRQHANIVDCNKLNSHLENHHSDSYSDKTICVYLTKIDEFIFPVVGFC